MNLFDAISSSSDMLAGQMASAIFSVLPEDGPAAIIVDRHQHYYTSSPDVMAQHCISREQIADICSRVDDGVEPVISQGSKCAIVASHVCTQGANYGHLLLVLPNYCPVAAMANMDLIETTINSLLLAARLLETISEANGSTASTAPPASWAAHCFN